jgi:type I restriction-modification system DNA methylase subunit
MKTIKTKRDKRKRQSAECFTPESLTNQILDKLNEYGKESWEEGKTFLDPACGTGNLLVPVLKRKISLGHNPTEALKTIYGTDIFDDNIKECRLKLLKTIKESKTKITLEHIKTVFNQIIVTRLSKYPKGSLDYDFSFPNKASKKDLERWLDGIENHNWMELVGHENINSIISNDTELSYIEEHFAAFI